MVTSEVAGDVISFRAGCAAIFPFAGEAKVVGTLSADVVVAQVVVEQFCVGVGLSAVDPKASQGGFVRGGRGWGLFLLEGGDFGRGLLWGAFDPCRLLGRRGGCC